MRCYVLALLSICYLFSHILMAMEPPCEEEQAIGNAWVSVVRSLGKVKKTNTILKNTDNKKERNYKYRSGDYATSEHSSALLKTAKPIEFSKINIEEVVLHKDYDRRTKIVDVSVPPYCFHCHLTATFPTYHVQTGTGFLVGPNHILTAAHIIFSSKQGGWANAVTIDIGKNENTAIKRVSASKLICFRGWTRWEDKQPMFNIAMIILEEKLEPPIGWYGLFPAADNFFINRKVHLSGYPVEKGMGELWTMKGKIVQAQAERLFYTIDTSKGQGGGAVWVSLPAISGYYVVGIHAYAQEVQGEGNIATRLSPTKFRNILKWMKAYGYEAEIKNFLHPSLIRQISYKNKVESLARDGDSTAQYALAQHYEAENMKAKAIQWYQKAAAQEHLHAQDKFAILSAEKLHHTKVEDSIRKAGQEGKNFVLLALLHSQNISQYLDLSTIYNLNIQDLLEEGWESQLNEQWLDNMIGVIYHEGRGVRQDYKKAWQAYKKAVAKGDAIASRNLGHMYYFGEGVTQNYPKALEYLSYAFNRGYKESFVINALVQIYLNQPNLRNRIFNNLIDNPLNWLESVIEEIDKNLPEQEKIKAYRLLSYQAYRKRMNTSPNNKEEYKKWEERARRYFEQAKKSIYSPLRNIEYSARGGLTADYIKTLQLYLNYRDDFLNYPSRNSLQQEEELGSASNAGELAHRDKGKETDFNENAQEDVNKKKLRRRLDRFLYAQLKLHQLSMVEMGATLYVPYVDENGFVWVFGSEDKGKNWRRYLPANSVEKEWIAAIEGFLIPVNNPVQMVAFNDKRLYCAFVTKDKTIKITYSNDGVLWESMEELKHKLGNEKITQLRLINIKGIPCAFWLGGNELNLWYAPLFEEGQHDWVVTPSGPQEEVISFPEWLPIEGTEEVGYMDLINYQNKVYIAYLKEHESIKVGLFNKEQSNISILKTVEKESENLTIISINLINFLGTLYLVYTDQYGRSHEHPLGTIQNIEKTSSEKTSLSGEEKQSMAEEKPSKCFTS